MNLPRWTHRAYAYLAGYFWLPCPLCGQYFGGHEWRDRNGLLSSIPDPPAARIAASASAQVAPGLAAAGRFFDPVWSSYKPEVWKLDSSDGREA